MQTAKHPTLFLTLLTLTGLAGCAGPIDHGEHFAEEGTPTAIGQLTTAQCAAGAKQDATLYDMSFNGNQLNSLGQGKLDLICKATAPGESVAVYLDVPHERFLARKAVVADYLRTTGFRDEQVALAEGSNTGLTTPSTYDATAIYKPDGSAADLGVTGGLGANGPGGTVGK